MFLMKKGLPVLVSSFIIQGTVICFYHCFDYSEKHLLTLFNHKDLTLLLSDPRVHWFCGDSEALKRSLDESLLEHQDRLGWLWLRAEEMPNSDFYTYFQSCATRWSSLPQSYLPEINKIYQALTPELRQVGSTYDLSCHQGCSSCCERNTGYSLFVNPLEWLVLYQTLWRLPDSERKHIYQTAVKMLVLELDYLLEVLFLLDTQPERLHSASIQQEVLKIARALPQQDCLLLKQKSCQVYTGRPLACRLYGSSHFVSQRPFTCDLDYSQLEQVLLDEREKTHLVDSELWRQKIWALHQDMDYCQILNLWMFTHLDFEMQDFMPQARLDYQQFQSLVRDETLLDKKINGLEKENQKFAQAL